MFAVYIIRCGKRRHNIICRFNSTANRANVEIGTGTGVNGQKWYLTNVGDGYVTLKNGNGYMLDLANGDTGDGTNIRVHSANGADAQVFKVVKGANGAIGLTTKVTNNQKSLDIYNWGTSDGTNVCQWTYYGANNQLWILEKCN